MDAMSSQTKLGAFAEDAPAPAAPTFNCWTCLQKVDVIIQDGHQKVICRGTGVRDFRDICSSWTNGKDLAFYHIPPAGFIPKKRRGLE